MIDGLHEFQFDICFSLHINEPFTLYVTGRSKKYKVNDIKMKFLSMVGVNLNYCPYVKKGYHILLSEKF